MNDFHLIQATDSNGDPAWINIRQICAIKTAGGGTAEICLAGTESIVCAESVSEVIRLIVDALNGDITEEPTA